MKIVIKRKRKADLESDIMDATQEPPEEKQLKASLSSGSTLLNLACSDGADGAFQPGRYSMIVGDSSAGKTFLNMTIFAEAANSETFANYDLIYDNVEDGMLMDVERLFGHETAKRIRPPAKEKNGTPIFSDTIEDFYFHIDDAVKRKKPFIYILDSMDGLTSESELDKFESQKKAARNNTQTAGSYGDGKAKKNSAGLRNALIGLRKTNSILIIISQTRDNVGVGFNPKTRSGGRALRFYATVELWLSVNKTITKTIMGKKRRVGINVRAVVEKNRITGKRQEVSFDIFPSYGIDDIGSCIDFLVSDGPWKKTDQMIIPTGLHRSLEGVKITKKSLIDAIEKQNMESRLRRLVQKTWDEIQEKCNAQRKKKYS